MDRVTPQNNEDAFIRWERLGRWAKVAFWVPPTLLILVAFLLALVVPRMPESQIVEVVLIVWVVLIYATVFVIVQLCVIKPRLGQLSKEACIFAAMVTVEELGRGNPVRASLSMSKLSLALSDFLGQKLVAFGVSCVAPRNIMHVTPETIPKRAVYRTIQASEETKDFQERLRDLAVGLRGNTDVGYLAAHHFLVWLDQKTEPYQKASKTFLDKRPTLRNVVVVLGPSILGALALIVAALLR